MPRIPNPPGPRGPKKITPRPKKAASNMQTVRSAEGRAMEKAKKKVSATYSGTSLPARAKVKGGFGATKPRSSGSSLRATGADARASRGSRANSSLRARGLETNASKKKTSSGGPTVRSQEGRAKDKVSKTFTGSDYPARAKVKGGFGATAPRSSGPSMRATGAEARASRGSRAGSSLRARGIEKGSVRTPGYTNRGGNTGGFGKTAYKARGEMQTVRSAEGRAKSKVKRKYS